MTAACLNALRHFMAMDGDFLGRFNPQSHFVAGHAQNFDADAQRWEYNFVAATARQNQHDEGLLLFNLGEMEDQAPLCAALSASAILSRIEVDV
jgi:hypothetical protein